MTRVVRTRAQTMQLVAGILIAALPMAFGVIRAATTGTDFRYLWSALAALAGAVAIMARAGAPLSAASRLVLALGVSTLLAATTAFLVGARSPGAVLVVALAFAGCAAVGSALVTRSSGSRDGRPMR